MRGTRFALLGVTVLVAATVVAVVLRSTSACAAPLSPADRAALLAAAERSGRATYYGKAAPGGACSFPAPPADHLTTAAGPADYAAAATCGGYLDVTGARGTVRVKVDNLCPECEAGHLDLSDEAFARLDDPVKGIVPITFRQVVDPKVADGLSFRVKEGSSQWWLALLVDNHGNPLRSVEVSADGARWTALHRTDYNYWLADGGAGAGPFRVRVTDVRGHVAVASGIAVKPGQVQRTSVRLYGSGAAAPSSSTGAGRTAGTATSATSAARSSGAARSAAPGTRRPATSIKGTASSARRTAPAPRSSAPGPANPSPAGQVPELTDGSAVPAVAVAAAAAESSPTSPPTSPTATPTPLTAALAGDTASPPITTAETRWWC